MLSFFDVEYANGVGRVCATAVKDNDDVLRNVARYTALVMTRLNKFDGSLLVKGESDAAYAGPIRP